VVAATVFIVVFTLCEFVVAAEFGTLEVPVAGVNDCLVVKTTAG
jgi:hypothetical protein